MWASAAAVLAGLAVLVWLLPSREPSRQGGGLRPMLAALQARLGRALARLLPSAWAAKLAVDLERAGLPLNLPSFVLLWLLMASGLPLLVTVVAAGAGSLSRLLLLMAIAAGAVGPHLWLRMRIQGRRRRALRDLPVFLDLLRVAVEAGQGIDAAMAHVEPYLLPPLADEARRLLQQLRLGYDREEAFIAFARRLDLEESHSLVAAILQAERTGGGVARALASQASYLRGRLRQRAQEEARRAPIKMLFPMALCLLPAMMLLLMGPAVLDLMQSLRQAR